MPFVRLGRLASLANNTHVQCIPVHAELMHLSEDFYKALPHKKPGQRSQGSALIDNKRLIAQKQDLCQVSRRSPALFPSTFSHMYVMFIMALPPSSPSLPPSSHNLSPPSLPPSLPPSSLPPLPPHPPLLPSLPLSLPSLPPSHPQLIRDMHAVSEATGWSKRSSSDAKYTALSCDLRLLDPASNEFCDIRDHIVNSQDRSEAGGTVFRKMSDPLN